MINGYGPQEGENEESRKSFYSRLDFEVKRAQISGALICIEMDSNAKLGPHIISGDPHPQSGNGKLLEQVMKENNLKVVNGSSLCKGRITRKRTTVNGTEESIIDHFIVCHAMYALIVSLQIDQERIYCLTKFTNKVGNKVCQKESDHNTLILEINQEWNSSTKQMETRQEILNYKNKEDFDTFVKLTSDSEDLRACFNDDTEDLETSSKKWLKSLKIILKASFSKLRIKKGALNPKLQLLFQKKETLKSLIAKLENENKFEEIVEHQDSLDSIEEKIGNICANNNKIIVDEHLGRTEDTIEGYSQAKTWRLAFLVKK